jgi:hypothetical protein
MNLRWTALTALVLLAGCATAPHNEQAEPPILIDDFESGTLNGWTADPNWRVDDNSAGGWYSGWQGKGFAWSGQGGEATTGNLRSKNLVLERDGIEVWLAGWADIQGRSVDRWNYVTLKLADGTVLDSAYAPNTTMFTPCFLNGRGNRGKEVYIEAVDNGTEGSYSMLCLDNITQRNAPRIASLPKYRRGGSVRLENEFYRIEVSRQNGKITRLLDKKGWIDFIREPRLAGNFKFTLPIRKETAWQSTEANYVLGEKQTLSSVKKNADSLDLTWRGPLTSVIGEQYDADVHMRIALVEDRVAFSLAIDNRTDLEIGELFYPMLGGTLGLASNDPKNYMDPKQTVMVVPARDNARSAQVFRNFENQSWLGIMGPEQHYGYPDQLSMPWMDFYQKGLNRGIYIGAVDPVVRFKVLHAEMFPGSSGPRFGGNWPTPEEAGDLPVGLRVSVVQMPYNPPRTRLEATPVIVAAHAGDWQVAARLHGTLAPVNTEAPGGQLLLECSGHDWDALPKLAEQAIRAGLNGIVATDWRPLPANAGEPLFALPDDEAQRNALSVAVSKCRALQAKVVFAIDIEPASQLRPAYDTLRDFACTDRWGIPDTLLGWGPPTTHVQNLAGTERRVILNPGDPAYRAILTAQVAALADIGVDGIRVGRFFGRALDFNPKTETTPDRASWEGGIKTLNAMRAAGRERNPDFFVLAEDSFDALGGSVDACGENPALKAAYPNWRRLVRVTKSVEATALEGADMRRTLVILAPEGSLDAPEWKAAIQRLREGMGR